MRAAIRPTPTSPPTTIPSITAGVVVPLLLLLAKEDGDEVACVLGE